LFDYAAEPRLRLVRQPVLVINPASPLAEASRAAARVMPNANLQELPDVRGAIFDTAADELALCIDGFLRG
jgi:hypothetical protein